MSKPPQDKTRRSTPVSRRDFLKHGASGVVALPFALAIASNAPNVVTTEERLRPFKEREEAFRADLEAKAGQGVTPKPPPPLPPQRKPVPINTAEDTSKNTPGETSTNSKDPPRADDSDPDTYYDGSKTDYKTDYV